jgi:hypothetical protein
MDLLMEEFVPEHVSEDGEGVLDTASWFSRSAAPRPDLPRAGRSPLHANRDWLRVLVRDPNEGGDHGRP